MRTNPFADTWQFLLGNQADELARGDWRWLILALFYGLLIGSVAVAVAAWRQDPEQRTFRHVATWLARLLVGAMWFQGSLWKLPLFTTDNGLFSWTKEMVQNSAFDWHRMLVSEIVIPWFMVFGPAVFLLEIAFAASLMLGFWVRLTGVIGLLFVANLWIGLYRHPGEWPWNYVFLALLMGGFSLNAAGRSLGIDGLLRHRWWHAAKASRLERTLVALT